MKKQYLMRWLGIGAFLAIDSVFGATVPAEMKATNTDACMKTAGVLDKYAPSDKSKLRPYCTCVSENYWSSVPQADYVGMTSEYGSGNFNGPHAKSLNDKADERLVAAQKKCSK